MAVRRHVLPVLLGPVTMTVAVPSVVWGWSGLGTLDAPVAARVSAAVAGAFLVFGGLVLVIWTIALFDRLGEGTLAPFDAPIQLVLRGPYRHVRNPMISGVLLILAGEAVAFLSPWLGIWCGVFFMAQMCYLPLLEEPSLERRFGLAYTRYREQVPRWLPRLRPYDGAALSPGSAAVPPRPSDGSAAT